MILQRLFDIILSGLAILVFFPLFLTVGLLLKFTGEGEIFYLQERVGKKSRKFKLIKFATMLKDSPNLSTGTITVKDDPRILPIGKFLRKSKLNELPQLLNVIAGNMSLVGPRPLTQQTFAAYSVRRQEIITRVKPGLSGFGSIIFRNEEEILDGGSDSTEFYLNVIAPYKGAIEEWFVQNQNIKLYFLCIFLTLWIVIFSPKGELVWKLVRNLPTPPEELKERLGYV